MRMADLAEAAASVLDDGRSPFCGEFLADNDVTFDECASLADMAALGLRIVAWTIENPAAATGAVNGANLISAYEAIKRWGGTGEAS